MNDIHVPQLIGFAKALLANEASQPVRLMPVPDVSAWFAAREGNGRGSPAAAAVRDAKSGTWGIVIRSEIPGAHAEDILMGVAIRAGHDVFEHVQTEAQFLAHLLLHELAHLENDWGNDRERDCDVWALARLPQALARVATGGAD